jgi:Leucine-rich repeat (LRR) protein
MLAPDVFAKFTNLRVLHLSANKLERVSECAFNGLNHLENLFLDGNEIAHLSPTNFSQFTHLKVLYLSNNNLKRIPPNTFSGLNQLEKLYLDGNKLKRVDNTYFTHLEALTHLNLSCNQISAIEEYSFLFLSNLQKLHLDSNALTSLPLHSFYGISNLQELDLKFNPLEPESMQAIWDVYLTLRSLSLNLELLGTLSIPMFPNLNNLDLSYFSSGDVPLEKSIRLFYKVPHSISINLCDGNMFG